MRQPEGSVGLGVLGWADQLAGIFQRTLTFRL
jgi:hypothetical protein